jgi:hypothetical protein
MTRDEVEIPRDFRASFGPAVGPWQAKRARSIATEDGWAGFAGPGPFGALFLAVLSCSPRVALAEEPERMAWAGLARGPLAPAKAEALEKLILDELDGYDSFRLVDAGGNALDQRLLASEAQRCASLKNEGIDLLLRFQYGPAIRKLDQAITVFEARLPALVDYELLHDALLAKAEALYHSGEKTAAKSTLRSLLALSPKTRPSAKTHEKGFVALYERAKADLDSVGRIQVNCEDPGCTVQIDGQQLGPAPLYATRMLPGRHYVVATWSDGIRIALAQVPAGGEARINIKREGPSEEARRGLLQLIEKKGGPSESKPIAQRVVSLAQASSMLVGAVRADANGKSYLLLGRHDRMGTMLVVARMPLATAVEDTAEAKAIRRLAVALFVDKTEGEIDLDPSGAVKNAPGIAAILYGGFGEAPQIEDVDPDAPPPPHGPTLLPSQVAPAPPPEDDSITGQWWFWTIIGVVVVGAAAGTAVVMLQEDVTTTRFQVNLP